jgi:polar amino acid transport system substrate-binding protein
MAFSMEKRLRIGFNRRFPPFTFMAGDHPSGPVLEFLADAATHAGHTPLFIPLDLDRAEAALLAGEVDALAFTAVTPERRERLEFSRPLLVTGAALFAPHGTPAARHGDIRLCSGLRVATPRRGPLAEVIRRHCPGAVMVLTQGYEESFRSVIEDRAEVAALNFHVGREIARQFGSTFAHPALSFEWLDMAVAASLKRDDRLVESLNLAIEALERNGALRRFHERFLMPPRIISC